MLKKLLNFQEVQTHSRLHSVCEKYGANVHIKVRLADVLPIERSQISNEDYHFALLSHFDFVVTNAEYNPLFAVEFDGKFHKTEVQRQRDKRKNLLCKRFNIPLLRVNSRYLLQKYRNMDLLSWLVEFWFSKKTFYEQQEAGNIPYDVPFEPSCIVYISGKKETFPLWPVAELLLKIRKLHNSGVCKDFVPGVLVGVDEEDNYHAIAYLRMNDSEGVYTETGMRSQEFPMPMLPHYIVDIVADLAIYELYDVLTATLKGEVKAKPLSQINKKVKTFQNRYSMRSVRSALGTH